MVLLLDRMVLASVEQHSLRQRVVCSLGLDFLQSTPAPASCRHHLLVVRQNPLRYLSEWIDAYPSEKSMRLIIISSVGII